MLSSSTSVATLGTGVTPTAYCTTCLSSALDGYSDKLFPRRLRNGLCEFYCNVCMYFLEVTFQEILMTAAKRLLNTLSDKVYVVAVHRQCFFFIN